MLQHSHALTDICDCCEGYWSMFTFCATFISIYAFCVNTNIQFKSFFCWYNKMNIKKSSWMICKIENCKVLFEYVNINVWFFNKLYVYCKSSHHKSLLLFLYICLIVDHLGHDLWSLYFLVYVYFLLSSFMNNTIDLFGKDNFNVYGRWNKWKEFKNFWFQS